MIRIVVMSDLHGDWTTLGVRRHEEISEAVDNVVLYAINEGVDLVVCAGDIADPDTGGDTFRSIEMVQCAALRLAEEGIPSLWVRGNHDVCEDGTGACVLTPMRALEVYNPLVKVAVEPRVVRFSGLLQPLAFVCLPFMPASHGLDYEAVARELVKQSGPRFAAVGHLMLPGIHPGTETTEMPRGREVMWPLEATAGALLRIGGHYHARQIYEAEKGPAIHIPGALARLGFGEEDHEPSFLAIDLPTSAVG